MRFSTSRQRVFSDATIDTKATQLREQSAPVVKRRLTVWRLVMHFDKQGKTCFRLGLEELLRTLAVNPTDDATEDAELVAELETLLMMLGKHTRIWDEYPPEPLNETHAVRSRPVCID
jgi:hypothetical protein